MPRHALAGCLAALVLAGTAVRAQPVLRYTWGDPDSVIAAQEWTGPHAYTQTLSVTGLSGPVSQLQVVVFTSILTPEAWYMTIRGPAPAPDCMGSPAFTVSPLVTGAQTAPGARVSAAGRWFGLTSPRPLIEVEAVFDPPFTADPGVRYALATLGFDHVHSAPGAAGPGACGQADAPYCFVVWQASCLRPDQSIELLEAESEALTWQDTGGSVDCLQAVPARATTWGSLKAIYR